MSGSFWIQTLFLYVLIRAGCRPRSWAASDYQKLQELAEQEAEYTAEYDALMEKWEELSEAIAAEEG